MTATLPPIRPRFVKHSETGRSLLRTAALALILVSAVLALMAFAPTQAEATVTAQAKVGMPFAGQWAYNQIVYPPYTDANSSHPTVHNEYSFQWSTDLYAAKNTAVKVIGSSPQGTVTFKRNGTSDTCSSYGANIAGQGVTFDVLVNGVKVGEVKYDHLDLVDVGNDPIASGTVVGEITEEAIHASCYQVSHTHIQFKNTVLNQSCYVDHGNPGASVLPEGTDLGVLNSTNTVAKQSCSLSPPPPPDADSDGITDANDDCPIKAGVASFYGCPAHTPASSSVPHTSESPYGTAISSWDSQRLDVFRVNANGNLEHRAFDSGIWTSWENLGGSIVGKPAAVSWGWGRIDVFAIGTDGKLKQKLIDNNSSWSQWFDLGTLPGSPACLDEGLAVTTWGIGRLDIFGIDCTTNAMKHLWLDNNQWQTWEDLGGCIQSAPTAVSWGLGRIDTFVRGCDDALYTKFVEAGWSGWVGLGGCLSSGPAVASQAPQRLDVFVRGCTAAGNSLLHMAYRPNAWSPWENWGGNIAQAPSAVSWAPNRLDTVGTAPDNSTQHFFLDREWPASGWGAL